VYAFSFGGRFCEQFRHLRGFAGFVVGIGREAWHCTIKNYNPGMARGWESKSVEAQQAEANEKRAPLRPPMSAEEAARWREKENLRLARQTVGQQLETTQNPRHRKLLEDSLAELDEKLK
jgi:hypothetical protein